MSARKKKAARVPRVGSTAWYASILKKHPRAVFVYSDKFGWTKSRRFVGRNGRWYSKFLVDRQWHRSCFCVSDVTWQGISLRLPDLLNAVRRYDGVAGYKLSHVTVGKHTIWPSAKRKPWS